MGNTDSIPVVSQVKSLVQVISGDEEGARRTQNQFLRTGIGGSQLTSAILAIQGDTAAARKVQEEFGEEMFSLAKSLPVVGHGISAGYAITGDSAEAEKIALGATKSTVVALAAAAGLACGPAAPACGGGLAVVASTGWDGAESGIKGEKVGSIKAWDNIVTGNSNTDEVFDTVAGHAMEFAGGSVGAKVGASKLGKVGKVGKGKYNAIPRCKRNTMIDNFSQDVPEIPDDLTKMLPSSFSDINFNKTLSVSTTIDSVLSVIFILKLMSIGHSRSKTYFKDICSSVYNSMMIEDCSMMLSQALNKFENGYNVDATALNVVSTQAPSFIFADVLDGLEFEMKMMTKNTLTAHFLTKAACDLLNSLNGCTYMVTRITQTMQQINKFIKPNLAKIRAKRMVCVGSKVSPSGIKTGGYPSVAGHRMKTKAKGPKQHKQSGKPKKLMSKEDSRRIQAATAKQNDGKTPKKSFSARAQSTADKNMAGNIN